MSIVMLTMAMSLDGFITGPNDDAENPAGIDGMRLMDWLGGGANGGDGPRAYRPSDPNSQLVFDEAMQSGAVITGRRTGEFAGYWGGDHHDGVPIFVPTHHAPADSPYELVHFVTDGIVSCVEQAKAAAGDRDVMMHGAYTGQQCLKAGVLDVIEIQLRPVLLGQGRRLFDNLPADHVELELVRTLRAPATCTCVTRSVASPYAPNRPSMAPERGQPVAVHAAGALDHLRRRPTSRRWRWRADRGRTMTTAITQAVVAVVIVIVAVAAVEYVRRCLALLADTSDGRLRYLTRAGWTAVIVFVIPIGALLFLGFGRDP